MSATEALNMKIIRHWLIVVAVFVGLGCCICRGEQDVGGEGVMPPPPPQQNGRPGGMGPGGMNGGPMMRGAHRREEFRKVWERLQKENPEEAARLEKLKQTNREEYYRELRKLFPPQVRVPSMTMKLDQQCWELGRQYKNARTEEERKAIRKELEELVEKSFEAMVQESKDRLEMLQKQLQEMEEKKDEINKKRLEMFLRGGFWKKPHGGDDDRNRGPHPMMPPPGPHDFNQKQNGGK